MQGPETKLETTNKIHKALVGLVGPVCTNINRNKTLCEELNIKKVHKLTKFFPPHRFNTRFICIFPFKKHAKQVAK